MEFLLNLNQIDFWAEWKYPPYLQVGAVVLGDVRTVALTEHRDLLLDVLDLILGLLKIDRLDGDDALSAVIDAFEDLRKETGSREGKNRGYKKTKEDHQERKKRKRDDKMIK